MIASYGYLAVDATEVRGGWWLKTVVSELQAPWNRGQSRDNGLFSPDNQQLTFDSVDRATKIGTEDRVKKDAFGYHTFFITDETVLKRHNFPFWLLPGVGYETTIYNCEVFLDDVSLFMLAGYQISSWFCFMYDKTFLGGPPIPNEQYSIAIKSRLSEGDALSVRIAEEINAVLVLDKRLGDRFSASIYQVGSQALEVGSVIDTFHESTIDDATATFQCKIGQITSLHQS